MRTHNIPSCYRKSKSFLLCLLIWRFHQPSLARTARLELTVMVPKMFEPLKFDCNIFFNKYCTYVHRYLRLLLNEAKSIFKSLILCCLNIGKLWA